MKLDPIFEFEEVLVFTFTEILGIEWCPKCKVNNAPAARSRGKRPIIHIPCPKSCDFGARCLGGGGCGGGGGMYLKVCGKC